MTAKKMTCRKCKRIFITGEGTWGNLCDSCAGVVRGLPGTPIEGFGIDKNALRHGANYADVATGEITHYTPAQLRQWTGAK